MEDPGQPQESVGLKVITALSFVDGQAVELRSARAAFDKGTWQPEPPQWYIDDFDKALNDRIRRDHPKFVLSVIEELPREELKAAREWAFGNLGVYNTAKQAAVFEFAHALDDDMATGLDVKARAAADNAVDGKSAIRAAFETQRRAEAWDSAVEFIENYIMGDPYFDPPGSPCYSPTSPAYSPTYTGYIARPPTRRMTAKYGLKRRRFNGYD